MVCEGSKEVGVWEVDVNHSYLHTYVSLWLVTYGLKKKVEGSSSYYINSFWERLTRCLMLLLKCDLFWSAKPTSAYQVAFKNSIFTSQVRCFRKQIKTNASIHPLYPAFDLFVEIYFKATRLYNDSDSYTN